MTASKEDVIGNLRAIIISSKGGLKLSEIRADYRETFGVDIPLKPLGYSSLEEFFLNNPKNFTIFGNTVQAVTKSSSVHIVSLVNRQNSRKKGRPKLTSKQARNLRRPARYGDEPGSGAYGRKSIHNIPPRLSRQNNNRNALSSAIRQMQEMQKMTASKPNKIPPLMPTYNPQKTSQSVSTSQEEGNKQEKSKQAQSKTLEELKGIKRTVINSQSSSAKDSSIKAESDKNSQSQAQTVSEIPFQDFEDLHISVKAQSRLLRIKNISEAKAGSSRQEPSDSLTENWGSPPASPFCRSLANTTEEEILSAKRTAEIRLDNNNINIIPKLKKKVDVSVDLEDDTKYEHKLKQFCIERGLILPNYTVISREPLNQPKCYGCKLTIGSGFHVSTYPVETHSEITARELASKKAYNMLSTNDNLPALFYETEFVVKLRALCAEKNLPEPVFKSIECHPKNERGYYICKVRVGDNILQSSYPEETQNELSARDLAAKKAFNYLNSVSIPSASISENDSATLNQIYDIIKTKEYGVWSSKLPFLYMDAYNKSLQPDWFDLIKNSPKFEITHIDKVGYILRAKTDEVVAEENSEPPELAPLKVPESNQWEVYITNVISSAEIWCRLIGKDYSELYDTMMTKLELQPPTVNAKNPKVGEVYLVNLEESWNRVRVTEISDDESEASVFLIDIGLDEVVKLSQLFYLQENFFTVPPQAILLSLHELDCLVECEELQSALLHCLLGNSFIAEVVAILDEGGNVSSVILWDTSTDEDVNVNLKLLDDAIRNLKSPTVPSVGSVREMYVSHVDDNGDVFLRTSEKKVQYIDSIISTKLKNSGKLVSVNRIDPKKLYVTRCNKKNVYYRAKLSKAVDAKIVIVKFIDFGYEQQVAIEDLYDLEQTSLDLATIPAQIIRAKIANLTVINSKVLAKLREFVLEQNVLVKITQVSLGSPPNVELFKRSQTDGTLSSVNNKIYSEDFTVDVPVRKKSYVIGLESIMSRDLPMPTLPPIGSFFNVIVTLAAHPGLFCVQPLSTQSQLMELMFQLQEKCDASYSKPLKKEDFKIGELYAVKHSDDFWYRAYAHAFVSSSAFTLCLCDFGDFIIVPPENLMPLSSEFKTFPYQAIRAYLAGVTPVEKDWRAEDAVKFREMVVAKQFVSQIIEINRDVKNPNYITLGLVLVDTSTADDIYIHDVLVEKNMAMFKT